MHQNINRSGLKGGDSRLKNLEDCLSAFAFCSQKKGTIKKTKLVRVEDLDCGQTSLKPAKRYWPTLPCPSRRSPSSAPVADSTSCGVHGPQKVVTENLDPDRISDYTHESVWCQDGAASKGLRQRCNGRHLEAPAFPVVYETPPSHPCDVQGKNYTNTVFQPVTLVFNTVLTA